MRLMIEQLQSELDESEDTRTEFIAETSKIIKVQFFIFFLFFNNRKYKYNSGNKERKRRFMRIAKTYQPRKC